MKSIISIACVIVGLILLVISFVWLMRTFNNIAVSTVPREVMPGVYCVTATTSDGVAIDCFPESWIKKDE